MWKDRKDFKDSPAFARHLRERAQYRWKRWITSLSSASQKGPPKGRLQKAKRFYESVIGHESFCVSWPLLTEAWLLIEARLGNHFANRLLEPVASGVFEMLALEPIDLRNVLELERKDSKADFGFVDASCFVLCEKYKIRKVFTYDRKHFSLYVPSFCPSLELLPA